MKPARMLPPQSKKANLRWLSVLGAPGRIRTSDPRIRSPMLYPAELRVRWGRGHSTGFRDSYQEMVHGRQAAAGGHVAGDVGRSVKFSERAAYRDSEARFRANHTATAALEGRLSNQNYCPFERPTRHGIEAAFTAFRNRFEGCSLESVLRLLCFLFAVSVAGTGPS